MKKAVEDHGDRSPHTTTTAVAATSASPSGIQHADLSFPRITTSLPESAFDEYREVTNSGIISGEELARRISTRHHGDTEEVTRLTSRLSGTARDQEDPAIEKLKFVTFKDVDPEDPRQWSNVYKWYVTAVVAIAVVSVAFASAVITGDFRDIEQEFGVSNVVVALSVSLMVVGFGIGPLLWSPLSELYGRRWCWLIPMSLYTIFNIPCALAPNIGTLLSCRFICGFFAAAPLTLAGGAISDVWDTSERGLAIALFAAAPYGGPVLGPIVGGFVGETIGWRWILWVNMIFAGVVTLALVTIPETYAPTILKKRAKRLRMETGDPTYVTEQEAFKRSMTGIIVETLIRPFQMLVQEPILLLMSMYIALIYGLLYAFFFSLPVIFGGGYGYNDGIVGLMFLPVLIGLGFALLATPQLERRYARDVAANGMKAEPEMRLPGMLLGVWFVPVSLFVMGWTAPGTVSPHGSGHWVGPASSGLPFGFGMVVIYFSANAYLIDAFPQYVASALAAKTVVRSGAGAAMPLFITAMFHNLGNQWAASLLAFISLAMVPIPFLFYWKGKAIRSRSKRATTA